MQGRGAAGLATPPAETPTEAPQPSSAGWELLEAEETAGDPADPLPLSLTLVTCSNCGQPTRPGAECESCGQSPTIHVPRQEADIPAQPHLVEVYGIEPLSYAKVLSVLTLAALLPVYLLGMSPVRQALGLHLSGGSGWASWRGVALYAGLYVAGLFGGRIYNLAADWTGGIRLRTNHPLPAHARLYEVRRLGVVSGLRIGGLAGIYLGFIALSLSLVLWPSRGPVAQPVLWLLPVWLGMGLSLAGMVGCLLYNALARLLGGVRLKLS